MFKSKKKWMAAGAVFIVAAIAVAYGTGLIGDASNALQDRFYDSQGRLINPLFTVVTGPGGTVEGVSSMDFILTVKNTGELPLTLAVESSAPTQFASALPTNSQNAPPGASVTWTSAQLPVGQFENSSKTFSVHVRGAYTYAGQQKTLYKDASISMNFARDPIAGFDVNLSSSVGSSGAGVTNTTVPPGLKTSGTTCGSNAECVSNLCKNTVVFQSSSGATYCTDTATCTASADIVRISYYQGATPCYYVFHPNTMTCTTGVFTCA